MQLGQIVEVDTSTGPAEAVITRVWDRPANDPYVTVKTTEDRGRTFVRSASRVRRIGA
jgi:hypothetical protein